jgi:hypothetical protein
MFSNLVGEQGLRQTSTTTWEVWKHKELLWDLYNPRGKLHINIPPLQVLNASQVSYEPRYTSHKTKPAWA